MAMPMRKCGHGATNAICRCMLSPGTRNTARPASPATRGGNAPDGRRVRGTIHWVSAAHAVPAEIRLYEPLFTRPDPGADGDMTADLNPHSLEVLRGMIEPGLAGANSAEPVQFERQGYFVRDPDSSAGHLVFNRTIGLRDSWAKLAPAKAGGAAGGG